MHQPLIPNEAIHHIVQLDSNGEIATTQLSHLIAFGSHRIHEDTAYNVAKIDLGVGTMDFKRLDASPNARGISGTQFNGETNIDACA